ncbi:MAG: protein DA1 [Candidatus Cloacimonetes bacterium]|nr:protein DA1 [Candidatus Cloacimonadota bacterium]
MTTVRNSIRNSCKQPLDEEYYYIDYGQRCHIVHDRNGIRHCFSCGRLIDPNIGGSSVVCSDGREFCTICSENGVNTKEMGAKALDTVYGLFDIAGITCPRNRISLELNNMFYAEQVLKDKKFYGLTTTTIYAMRNKPNTYLINIITGLHYEVFLGVLGHELMHVYIKENNIQLKKIDEEGLCELVCYYIYEARNSKVCDVKIKNMIESSDPIYGEGFRIMKKRINGLNSWNSFISQGTIQ